MRTRVVVGILAVVVIALGFVSWRQCSSSKHTGIPGTRVGSTGASGAGGSRARKPTGPVVPASLSGRVTRAGDGAGIAGARVSIAPAELLAMFSTSSEPPMAVVTDASGAWKAPNVLPGAYVVAATATGFLPGVREKLVVGSGEQRNGVDLSLTAGGTTVRGTVTDVGGGPIADARVTATIDRNMPELSGEASLVAITGADGRYELTLADGDYQLIASHDDYASESETAELSGSPVVVDFSLIPGATIRGIVVTRDDKPVPAALIRAEAGGRGGDRLVRTDEAGQFVLRGLRAGNVSLHAQARGVASTAPTTVELGIGEQIDGVKIVVDRAYSISGRVVRKGKPDQGLPGVTLGAFSIASKAFGLALEPSHDDGSFEIVGLKPTSYTLFAVGEGSVPDVGKNVEVVDKDVEDVLVELGAGATLAGRVEPATAGVDVSIAPAGGIGLANMFDAMKSLLVRAKTAADGTFTLKNVPSGAFKLTATAPSGSEGTITVTVADVDQNGLVVKLESRGSIAGRVVDTKGQPVGGASITSYRVHHADEPRDENEGMNFGRMKGMTTSAADGTFKLVGLEAGTYKLRAHLQDNRFDYSWMGDKEDEKRAVDVQITPTTAKTGVTLTVETRDGVIRGTVIGADKKGAADSWVVAHLSMTKPDGIPDEAYEQMEEQTKWGGTKPVLTDADGRFTIGKLKKGKYKLVVTGPKGASRAEKPDVSTGDNVTIQLASLGTLTGKVTVDGKPVTPYEIECESKGDDGEQSVTAADGSYKIERLAPGSYTCNVTSSLGSATGKIDVPTGPVTLDLTLTRWASITGVVLSVLDKKPVSGVFAFAGENAFAQNNFEQVLSGKAPTTDATGRFTITQASAGKGQVRIMPKDNFMELATRPYTAVAGQKVDLGTIEVIPPRSGEAGTFGFATNVDGDKLVVSSVKEGGPAALAGMKEGDRLVAIVGREIGASGIIPPMAQQALSSGTMGVGQPIQLTLERAGAKVEMSLVSVKW